MDFMFYESKTHKPGEFFCKCVDDNSVISARDKTGALQVLLNSCRHRGNAVGRVEQGHISSFLCAHDGWTYALDGKRNGNSGVGYIDEGMIEHARLYLYRARCDRMKFEDQAALERTTAAVAEMV